jgi:hypothetical protein
LTGAIGKSCANYWRACSRKIRYVATAYVVGMNMDCEALCWSEIAHGNDVRTGQRADTGEVTVMTANAGND